MVPTMEELCECVTEWRDILLGNGLEVNAAKSIVIVDRRAVRVSVVSVGKSAGSVMYTGCKK